MILAALQVFHSIKFISGFSFFRLSNSALSHKNLKSLASIATISSHERGLTGKNVAFWNQ